AARNRKLRCIGARRRSRYRWRNRTTSSTSTRSSSGNGGGSASLNTSIARATTSTWPVAISSFPVPSRPAPTSPSARTPHPPPSAPKPPSAPNPMGNIKCGRINNDLHDAGNITHVEEHLAAVIAPVRNPAANHNALPDVVSAKIARAVGPHHDGVVSFLVHSQ